MPKAAAPPTAMLAAKSEKSLQMSGLLAKIKDPSVGDLRESVIDAASNKEGAIDRADFERLAAAIKEEAVSDYEAKQAMVAKLGRSKNRVRYFGAAAGCLVLSIGLLIPILPLSPRARNLDFLLTSGSYFRLFADPGLII